MRVNAASGNVLVNRTDLAESDLNYHVVVNRAYNSLAADDFSVLGPRWVFDVGPATRVEGTAEAAVVTGPTGWRVRFVQQPDGSYAAPAGFDGSLQRTSGGWDLRQSSTAQTLSFDVGGRLVSTRDAAGRDFSVQNTSAAGRTVLSSYGTPSGRRANLSYTGDSLVRELDDPASGHHYYRYTAGRLTEVENPDGTDTYAYGPNGC